MIDDSDVDDFLWLSILTDNPIISVLLLVVAIGLYFAASDNKDECAKKVCPNGAVSRLLDHSCLCVTEAK